MTHMPKPLSLVAAIVSIITGVTAVDSLHAADGEPIAMPVQFESPPVVNASTVLTDEMMRGPHHRVRDVAPSDGFMIHFTVDTNYGVIECRGTNELMARVNELQAIQTLVDTSKTDLFAKGLKQSVEQPIDAVRNMAHDPEGTIKRAPATIGHFFEKVGSSISKTANKVHDKMENSSGDTEQSIADAGEGITEGAKSVAGFDRAKLDCARQLGVDPYSDNKLLQSEMEKVTWAFFAGGLPLRLGAAMVSTGASLTLTATKTIGLPDDIYDVTPGELVLRDRTTMTEIGASDELINRILINPSLTTSLRHGIVTTLATLPGGTDRTAVLDVASNLVNLGQAAFFHQMLAHLAVRHQSGANYQTITMIGRAPAGVTTDGTIELVAPVDLISWTPKIADYAASQKAKSASHKLVVIGEMTATAKAGFIAEGWTVEVIKP